MPIHHCSSGSISNHDEHTSDSVRRAWTNPSAAHFDSRRRKRDQIASAWNARCSGTEREHGRSRYVGTCGQYAYVRHGTGCEIDLWPVFFVFSDEAQSPQKGSVERRSQTTLRLLAYVLTKRSDREVTLHIIMWARRLWAISWAFVGVCCMCMCYCVCAEWQWDPGGREGWVGVVVGEWRVIHLRNCNCV